MPNDPAVQLILLESRPIIQQLSLEQALLSLSQDNYLIVHQYPQEAVVMGISGKKELLVHQENLIEDNIPLIQRYSGGGCVYLNHHSLMLSFLFNKDQADGVQFPQQVMNWSFQWLKKAFGCDEMKLKENDFTFREKKCGGNAQYIKKDRFCHHLSLLHRVDGEKMKRYLKLPKKVPEYRQGRSHSDFLQGFYPYFSEQKKLVCRLREVMGERYELHEMSFEKALEICKQPFRNSNKRVEMKKAAVGG